MAHHSRPTGLLPHEWTFGGFLVVLALRLLVTTGLADLHLLLVLGLLAALAVLVARCRAHPTDGRWQARLWFHPPAMMAVYFSMGGMVAETTAWRADGLLAGIDRAMFGRILSVQAEAWAHPAATEVLSLCYLLFYPYMAFSWFHYSWRGHREFRSLIAGMFTLYGLGFLGYLFLPAAGPHLAFAEEFHAPLRGWLAADFNSFVVRTGSNHVDVFPSLHCGITAFLLGFDRRHCRARFRLLAWPCAGLWVSTIYLRFHYFADVAAGLALAVLCLAVSRRVEKRDEAGE